MGQIRPLDFNDVLLESHALDITGVRRCGKSTIMRQRMRGSDEPWFYVNFESPLLTQFELRDTIMLDSLIDKSGAKRLFFDEVDQLTGWEKYVRQKLDEGFCVCVSGSNASLLEGEIGTKLTGRHSSKELFPFSFSEYLAFTGKERSPESAADYVHDGGFPRYLQTREEIVLQELLATCLILDMETKFLCREDCKGLCARCGRNLNLGPCGCGKEIDPRFAVLEQLLEKE